MSTTLLEPAPTSLAQRLFVGRRRVLVDFCLVAVVYLVTSTPAMSNDTRASAAAAWNVANYGTLDFHAAGFEVTWHMADSPSGALLTDRFPGTFLVAVPFYWLLPVGGTTVSQVEAVPYGPSGIAAALLVAGGIVALVEVLRTVVTPGQALGSGLVVAFATPMWSVAGRALWTHSVGAAVLGIAVLAITRERWWLAGAALGWGVFARPTYAIMAAVLGIGLAWSRRAWGPVVGIGVPSAIGLASLSWYSHVYFGTWLPVAGYSTDRVDAMVGVRRPCSASSPGPSSWWEQ